MKRLKTGVVNSISFIRNLEYTINSFDILFEKIVGSSTLSLTEISDNNNLDSCTDFITLNIDLLSNELEGGEYHMTISNGSTSTTYLCEVESYTTVQGSSGVYSDTIRFTDL